MQNLWLVTIALLSASLLGGCKSTECGEGTLERDGTCVPADETISAAACGAFTELRGGVCVPQFPPTVCDPSTTEADTDDSTGVTTCIGTGVAGCAAPLACPAPAAGKQTICGRLYDFETGAEFAAAGATGVRCTTPTADGPCSLGIRAFDAFSFALDPTCAGAGTCLLQTGEVYIDDCGRYRVPDIEQTANLRFVGLGIDDAAPANAGPPGTTNTIGIARAAMADETVRDFEGFVAPKATTDKWVASGGPAISSGIYAMIFRAAKTGLENRDGVAVLRNGAPAPDQDHYFVAAQTTRSDIDPAALVTGVNGTALVTGATVMDGTYSGSGLPPECRYTQHVGASLPQVLFIQIARPIDTPGMTCPL